MLTRPVRFGILLPLLFFFVTATHAQPYFKLDSNIRRSEFAFNFVHNMVVVHLKINNKGPYNFVLDTGVGLMIITDPKLVDSLDIKNRRSITVSGMGEGKDFEAVVTSGLKVSLPGITANDISAAILKKDDFGLSNYVGLPIHGLLGYEFFSSFAVKINFTDSTIVAALSKDMHTFKHGERLPITIEDHKPYMVSKVAITGKEKKDNKLIVDLGAGHPLSLENFVDQNSGLPDKFIASNLGVSLTGPIRGYLARVNEIDIGKYVIKNVITSFPEIDTLKNKLLSIKRNGNIGMDILKRFNMIFDYENGWLYLKPNGSLHDPFEHDMSGIEYYAASPDLKRIFISNVEKGSAAAEIGLQKGDEILSINFKPVEKMSIQQIDDLFRSRDDRSILLEIFHDDQTDRVIMVLKRRI